MASWYLSQSRWNSVSDDVRFGSLAVVQHSTILMSASGGIADVRRAPTPREVDSPGTLRPLATTPEPIAVLEVPLIAA